MIRDVRKLEIESRRDERAQADLIEFRVTANGFLRYMVRSIVGTLMEVGRCEKDIDIVAEAIATGNRKLAGMTAVARGLTLYRVYYD